MKITVCPDSYKGSLTAQEVSEVMGRACRDAVEQVEVISKPMADGGEGTVDALVYSTLGRIVECKVTGPLGDEVSTYYGVHGNGKVAFVEAGNTVGITMVSEEKRNPYNTTSYGLGQIIKQVINDGFEKIIIGLGGSATNDGGLGLLTALGANFINKKGEMVNIYGRDLADIIEVDLKGLDPRLKQVHIQVASDVDNPLCGPKGASEVFGPQKGASPDQVRELDQALHHFGSLINQEVMDQAGAGAAGGLGFALMAIGGHLMSGAELVGRTMDLESSIASSDLIITGEGKSDAQTLFGKVPSYISNLSQKHHKPVILISGSIDDEEFKLMESFSGVFSIINRPLSLEEAMKHAEKLIYYQTYQVVRYYSRIN